MATLMGCLLLLGLHQTLGLIGEVRGGSARSEVLRAEATADSVGVRESGCLCTGAQEAILSDTNLFLLQGRLTGLGGEDLPTVVIVAHYDSFGVAPVSILSSCSSLFLSVCSCLFFPCGLCPCVFSLP